MTNKTSRGAWLVWGVAVFAYMVSVTQRTSFGVAGLEATERFNATAAVLGTFGVVQLVVYAALQIPVGTLVDRIGSRWMIAIGAVLMAAGQFVLALAGDVVQGYVGRVLVGAGDAMTFVSVMRLVPAWFAPRLNPVMSQLTGTLGQVGQLMSLFPVAWLLGWRGWTTTFVSLAAMSVLAFALTVIAVKDFPGGQRPSHSGGQRLSLLSQIKAVGVSPGTWLGFWTHWLGAFSVNVYLLVWGYPYLVSGMGYAPARASALMSMFVFVAMVFGPILGVLVARYPYRRSLLVITISMAGLACWVALIVWPGGAPLWMNFVAVTVLACGGPASMIAFDFTRTENPPHLAGTATGVANVGSFSGGLIAIGGVGLVLDAVAGHPSAGAATSGGALYTLEGFQLAFTVVLAMYAIGYIGFFVSLRLVRKRYPDYAPLRHVFMQQIRARRRVR